MGVKMIGRSIFALLFAIAVLFGGGNASAQIVVVEDDFGNQRAYFGMTQRNTGLMQLIGDNYRTATVEMSDDQDGGLLNLRTQDGEPTAFLGAGSNGGDLFIYDTSGNRRTAIGVSNNGTGIFEVFARNGQDTVELSDDGEGGYLSLRTLDGEDSVIMSTNDTGGDLFLFDTAGQRRASIGVSDSGAGIIELFDNNGRDSVELNAGEDGGAFFVRSPNGNIASGLTVDEDGGIFTVRDNAGDAKIGLFIDRAGNGVIELNGNSIGDVAEVFPLHTRGDLVPGTVVSMHGSGDGLQPTAGAYDPSVVGVISGANGLKAAMTIGSRADGSNDLAVAMTGRAYVRVSAADGSIQVGDLLVASDRPGMAMRADDRLRALGAVVGKALENYTPGNEGEEAMILMLVMRL